MPYIFIDLKVLIMVILVVVPVAPAKDLRNCFLSIDCPMLTIVFVTVVPMFAPMMMFIAGVSSNTAKKLSVNFKIKIWEISMKLLIR